MPAQLKPTGGLEGCGVLVTGGGTGIGAACARVAAADGAAVTICGRTEASLAASVEKIEPVVEHGGSIRYVVGDVTEESDVERIVAGAVEATGTLDGVVANAGGGGALAPLGMQDVGEFERVMRLNATGTFLTAKHSLPHLIASKGSFVGMSSFAGAYTHRYFTGYTAGKGALEQVVRNAADEYGALGVRFNAVRPGFITTEIMEGISREGSTYESYLVNTPLGRVGDPDEVANVVRFLLGRRIDMGHRPDHQHRRRELTAQWSRLRRAGRDDARARRDPGRRLVAMAEIVIAGGGLVGNCSAMLLAADGHSVTVLERDPSLPPTSADEAWTSWTRRRGEPAPHAPLLPAPIPGHPRNRSSRRGCRARRRRRAEVQSARSGPGRDQRWPARG